MTNATPDLSVAGTRPHTIVELILIDRTNTLANIRTDLSTGLMYTMQTNALTALVLDHVLLAPNCPPGMGHTPPGTLHIPLERDTLPHHRTTSPT